MLPYFQKSKIFYNTGKTKGEERNTTETTTESINRTRLNFLLFSPSLGLGIAAALQPIRPVCSFKNTDS